MFIEQETLNPNKKITCSKPGDTCRNNKAVLIKHETFVLKSIVSNGSSKISLYLKKMVVLPKSRYVNSNFDTQKFLKLYP